MGGPDVLELVGPPFPRISGDHECRVRLEVPAAIPRRGQRSSRVGLHRRARVERAEQGPALGKLHVQKCRGRGAVWQVPYGCDAEGRSNGLRALLAEKTNREPRLST